MAHRAKRVNVSRENPVDLGTNDTPTAVNNRQHPRQTSLQATATLEPSKTHRWFTPTLQVFSQLTYDVQGDGRQLKEKSDFLEHFGCTLLAPEGIDEDQQTPRSA